MFSELNQKIVVNAYLTFSDDFILVKEAVDPEPVLVTLRVRQEYTLDEATFTHLFASLSNLSEPLYIRHLLHYMAKC